MTDKIVVLTTCESEDEAERIARSLIDKRVAACVNILPKARSIYRWKGAVEDAQEFVLLIKTRRDIFEALRAELSRIHSYEIPEIIVLPVVDGSEGYLSWIDRELTS